MQPSATTQKAQTACNTSESFLDMVARRRKCLPERACRASITEKITASQSRIDRTCILRLRPPAGGESLRISDGRPVLRLDVIRHDLVSTSRHGLPRSYSIVDKLPEQFEFLRYLPDEQNMFSLGPQTEISLGVFWPHHTRSAHVQFVRCRRWHGAVVRRVGWLWCQALPKRRGLDAT